MDFAWSYTIVGWKICLELAIVYWSHCNGLSCSSQQSAGLTLMTLSTDVLPPAEFFIFSIGREIFMIIVCDAPEILCPVRDPVAISSH